MKLVEVIPISKAISHESLSYFTSKSVPLGSIVSVPLRSKKVNALVVGTETISASKADLRSKRYSLKKIHEDKPKSLFLPEFIKASKELADFSAATTGAVLHSLLPNILLEKTFNLGADKNNGDVHEKYVIQSDRKERFSDYKNIVRENIAKGKSVILIAPSSKLAENTFRYVKKGIENYCFLIHGALRKSELTQRLSEATQSPKAVVVVATGKFLAIPRSDFGAIIVEKENSSLYKSQVRPYVDFRIFAEYFARILKARIYFGDLYLRTETIWRQKEGELIEFNSFHFKVGFQSKLSLVDMKSKKISQKNFKIVGPELEKLVKRSIKDKEKIFLYTSRKGLHPLTSCGDCGESVRCARCDSPLVLHKRSDLSSRRGQTSLYFFLCHHCGKLSDAEVRCQKCNSWNLAPLGIGIELVEKKLKEHFKDVQVFKIDGDSTPTKAKAEKVMKEFQDSEGGVMLGTEMALNYLESVDYAGVVSMDSFFSIPDFRINEKIINIVFSIWEKTQREFVMQTRNIDQEIIEFIKGGDLAGFYRNEIKKRELFGFPPFCNFIKITFAGNKESVNKESIKLKEFFADYDLSVYPGFVSRSKAGSVMNALIKIEKDKWPNDILREKILALPQKFSVDMDPDNLL